MTSGEIIQTLIEYHTTTTRRVWDSIEKITDEQFLQDDAYSRGSIRNLMIHLASTDRRWLAGLKNLPDTGHLDFKDYPTTRFRAGYFRKCGQGFNGLCLRPYRSRIGGSAGRYADLPGHGIDASGQPRHRPPRHGLAEAHCPRRACFRAGFHFLVTIQEIR